MKVRNIQRPFLYFLYFLYWITSQHQSILRWLLTPHNTLQRRWVSIERMKVEERYIDISCRNLGWLDAIIGWSLLTEPKYNSHVESPVLVFQDNPGLARLVRLRPAHPLLSSNNMEKCLTIFAENVWRITSNSLSRGLECVNFCNKSKEMGIKRWR